MVHGWHRLIFCRPFHGLREGYRSFDPAVNCRAIFKLSATRTSAPVAQFILSLPVLLVLAGLFICLSSAFAFAQVGAYEGRPVASVEATLGGTPPDASAQAEFKSMQKVVAGTESSAATTRQSLHDLFASG